MHPQRRTTDWLAGTPVSRRGWLQATAGLLAESVPIAAQTSKGASTLNRLLRSQTDPNRRILMRGAILLTLDPKIGDFERADLLIEGKKIAAVGPNLGPSAGAAVV